MKRMIILMLAALALSTSACTCGKIEPGHVGVVVPLSGDEKGKEHARARLDEIAAKQAAGTPIEIWWQDEARIGQKNKITRRWARRGTWPSKS